ncbi:winged helix-turn-helix domain-containing protein [Fulvimonas yonginensis]|uniref:Winged helix-turn-helix domain-containing protein n=1 Tax=Fulvimonas yonginensis TaxID=1495200 RepID=A0ABU8JAX7_9GAMM
MQDAHRPTYAYGPFHIDPAARRLLRDGQEVPLEAKVFDLILLLVEQRAQAVGKQALVDALWGPRPVTDAALSQLVFKARRALDDDGERQAVIRTVYGRGLQWVAPVSVVAQDAPAAARKTRQRGPWRVAGAIALAVLVLGTAAAGWMAFAPHGPPPAPPRERLALLPVANDTGDPHLDWTAHGLPGLVAGLLESEPALDVVDPQQIEQAMGYAAPAGGDVRSRVGPATAADVVVDGRLRKLPGGLFALRLALSGPAFADRTAFEVTDTDLGALGMAAAARLRRALDLAPTAPVLGQRPHDAYLAQTYARGMDQALHGEWKAAIPYFLVVAQGEPRFAWARLMLAQAQADTDQPAAARQAFAALLDDAAKAGDPRLAAHVLGAQLASAINRHDDAEALRLSTQALAAAERADDPDVLAQALIGTARIDARLGHPEAALRFLARARQVVDRHHLAQWRGSLANAQAFVAYARGDAEAGIAAAREQLQADEALGDERGAAIARFNLANALDDDRQPLQALPLLVSTWQWAATHREVPLQVAAGNLLASIVYDQGAFDRVRSVSETVARLAQAQDNRFMQARMLGLLAGSDYFAGQTGEALAAAHRARLLVQDDPDPEAALDQLLNEAFVALRAAPATLPALQDVADRLGGRSATTVVRWHVAMMHALAAAVRGDRAAAHAAFAAAGQAPADLRAAFALQIALTTADDALAGEVLRAYDPLQKQASADTLRLYAAWATRHGDATLAQRARAALGEARQAALAALGNLASG